MKADSPPRGRRKSTTPRADAPKASIGSGVPLDRTSNPRISAAPRDTVEVRPSWIEADPSLGAVWVSPPTLIGAAADWDTLEARNSWLQVEEDGEGEEEGSAQGRSAIPPPLPVTLEKAVVEKKAVVETTKAAKPRRAKGG